MGEVVVHCVFFYAGAAAAAAAAARLAAAAATAAARAARTATAVAPECLVCAGEELEGEVSRGLKYRPIRHYCGAPWRKLLVGRRVAPNKNELAVYTSTWRVLAVRWLGGGGGEGRGEGDEVEGLNSRDGMQAHSSTGRAQDRSSEWSRGRGGRQLERARQRGRTHKVFPEYSKQRSKLQSSGRWPPAFHRYGSLCISSVSRRPR